MCVLCWWCSDMHFYHLLIKRWLVCYTINVHIYSKSDDYDEVKFYYIRCINSIYETSGDKKYTSKKTIEVHVFHCAILWSCHSESSYFIYKIMAQHQSNKTPLNNAICLFLHGNIDRFWPHRYAVNDECHIVHSPITIIISSLFLPIVVRPYYIGTAKIMMNLLQKNHVCNCLHFQAKKKKNKENT